MSQDGRYKNFACRQRLVQNPNYVDQESKAATKNVGPAATTLTTSGHNHTGNNNHNNNHHHSSTNVSSKKSNVVSSPISSYNHHHNTSHTNGPAAVTGNNNSNSASNHDHTSSHQHSSHQSHSGNNGTLSTLALIELGQHRLQYRYNLWFSKRLPGKLTSSQFYDQTLKLLSTFGTVEQFWSIYSYLLRPAELPGHFDFHLFKEGIKPMWEDEANKRGGKWIIRLKKGISSRCWENLVLAILGEQFMLNDEICGAVISMRYAEDIISVWNRNSSDTGVTGYIRDTLRRILNLPANTIMQYKPHNESLKDLSTTSGTSSGNNNSRPSESSTSYAATNPAHPAAPSSSSAPPYVH